MSESMLYTIGHSNHELVPFVALLRRHGITAVADVRSSPYSQYNPQFNRETLADFLREAAEIEYVYLGRELGARREEPECFDERGQVVFERVAQTPLFRAGLERITAGMAGHRMALMCAEKDPLTCHRMMLICRHAPFEASSIRHIREDGSIETHDEAESRLLRLCRLPERDLFRNREELLRDAYEMQSGRVAWTNEQLTAPSVAPQECESAPQE